MNVMTAGCLILIAAVAGTPIGAAMIVIIASRREDHAWTLGNTAPGMIEAIARRILAFHADENAAPRRRGHPSPQLTVKGSGGDVVCTSAEGPAGVTAIRLLPQDPEPREGPYRRHEIGPGPRVLRQ